MIDFSKMTDLEMFQHDENIFMQSLNLGYLVVLDNGIGDHIVFETLMDELFAKHPKISMACCYPEIFDKYISDKMQYITLDMAKCICNVDELNIYKKMNDWNWKKSLQEAYRKLYL